MLYKKCIVTVSGNKAKLDEDIHLYRLDKNIDLYFTITNNKYKFNKDDANSNIVTLVNAAYSQVRLYKDEKLKYTFPIQPTERGDAILTISEDLIDEYIETGDYDLQISLLDRYKKSMVSMPIIYGQIHIHEPLGSEYAITGKALAGLSKLAEGGEIKNAFDENGNYVKEIHIDGEVITAELLNKFEKAFEMIFKDKTTAVKVNEQTYNPVNGVIELPDYTKNSDFTTEQTSTSFIIRFKGIVIANIPLQNSSAGGTNPDDVIYTITNNLTNCTNNNSATSAYKNSSYTATITPNSGYAIKSISVTMGGTNITSTAVSNNTITIQKVTGEVVITAVAEIITYPITNTLTKCSTNNSATRAEHDSVYEAIITADENYKMDSIAVTMGNVNIDSSYITPITETENEPTEPSEPSEPGSPTIRDVLSSMTYGKGINQTTAEIKDEPNCWATVNPVSVTVGKSYTITLNATWLWVINCDNDGNAIIPFLTTGSNTNPQTHTFTASSSKIKFGCYDPSKQLTYCTLTENGESPSQPIVPGGQPTLPSQPDTASETFSILAVNPVTISENYATGEITPNRGVGVTDLSVSRGQTFNIMYCTNSPANKHELSRDNGSTYTDITSSVTTTGTSSYKYQHSAVSNVSSYNMAIRVTNASGHTSVRSFVVTFI